MAEPTTSMATALDGPIFRDDAEDYGEKFVGSFNVNQSSSQSQHRAPVLKRAATAFADMLATSSDLSNEIEPFPFAPPKWDLNSYSPPETDDLLDLNVPFVDCGCTDSHKDFLLQDYPCDELHKEDEDKFGPLLMQFPSVDENGDIILKEVPQWVTDDAVYTYYDNLPSFPASAPLPAKVSVDFFSQEYLVDKMEPQTAENPNNEEVQNDDGSSITESDTQQAGPSVLPRPTGFHHPQESCTSDCNMLVDTICNLSKVLLAHYESKTVVGSVKDLQTAVLNLSRCLLHAHPENAAAESELADDEDFPPALDDEDKAPGIEQQGLNELENFMKADSLAEDISRLKAMMEMRFSAAPAHEVKNAEKPSYDHTSVKEVEKRLAILKARPNKSEDANEEASIHVEDDYMAKQLHGMTVAAKQSVDPQHVNGRDKHEGDEDSVAFVRQPEKILLKPEPADKSDSEESGWEHV